MSLTFHQHQLDNGLTIIAETDPTAYTAAVGFYVNTGARDEVAEVMGVSHFLEHMMFKGTDRRTAEDVNREFDEIGANYNAYTSHEQTVYYAHVIPEMLPKAIDLLSDMLRPSLREDDFSTEKNVILEEIGMYDDRPEWRLHDALNEAYFADHPLGHRVLGTAASIKALTATQMRDYFEQRYQPGGITVALAGNVDLDAVIEQLAAACGGWPQMESSPREGEVSVAKRELDLQDAKLQRHYVAMLMPGPSAQDSERFAAKVLADLLGDHDGSRLYWAMIEPGLVDEVDFSLNAMDGLGAFSAYLSCDPGRAGKAEKVLLDTLAKASNELTEEEVTRAATKLATRLTLGGEQPRGRMERLGRGWAYRKSYMPLDEQIDKFLAVKAADVLAIIEKYPLKPVALARLGPK